MRANVAELEKFKMDIEPQLETARREIELNKSMLDMLNNEINHLNTEKLQLEKKLINARRNTTPSVIVEEDEEDLEEEEREATKMQQGQVVSSRNDGLDVASSACNQGETLTPHGSLLFLNKVNRRHR